VPNLATTGYIFSQKLPEALGLTGVITERITPRGHQRLILTQPVGTHPLVAQIMAASIQSTLKNFGLKAEDTALVVIGHGSTKSRASFTQTKKVAHEMAQFGLIDLAGHEGIFTAFLEEIPYIQDWHMQTQAQNIIFAPALISDGYHANRDIPLAIGFDPSDRSFMDNLSKGLASKRQKDGKCLVYLPPVGLSPDISEIIFSRVKQAHENLTLT